MSCCTTSVTQCAPTGAEAGGEREGHAVGAIACPEAGRESIVVGGARSGCYYDCECLEASGENVVVGGRGTAGASASASDEPMVPRASPVLGALPRSRPTEAGETTLERAITCVLEGEPPKEEAIVLPRGLG